MTILLGFFLLSIIFSFLCSVWEAVLLSVTPSYIKRKEQEAPATGKLLAELKDDIDKPLSAILTLNTIAHTVGAIGVGAQAGKLFGTSYIDILGIQLTYESLIATLMTLAILFLSEIIPKTIGANNWKSLAPLTARAIRVLMWVLTPFVWLSNQLTKILKKDKDKSVFSRQDFAAITEVANESGAFDKGDYTLIKNVLHFDELTAEDVMTPRTVMVMAEENQTLKEYYEQNQPMNFSRIPLYHESKDAVTGILLKDDLLLNLVEGKSDELLKNVSRELSVVWNHMPLRKVFETLNEKREHLAVVVDEYGGLMGLVTLEDVIETLFGLEIMDETDAISDLQSYARQKWEQRAKKLGLIE
ncbi:hemolysin family protein [Catalinimonas niigatensis]|uniref:hemolysin family protein n=1 Tax=Catalinimonas niigatensis TaxID=1397264 RepID=UPI0026657D1E|nr:hemolysin family protein [Catalinimonas niigatensis]WPP50382.1 hemolysin family protein [Catalinimonas niigatensis]